MDVLTLLEAQRRLLKTERQHVTARAQAISARIDLELAVGAPLSAVVESPPAVVPHSDVSTHKNEEN